MTSARVEPTGLGTYLICMLATTALLVGSFPIEALAYTCQSGGDYNIDCTEPDSTGCSGSNSNAEIVSVPGLGHLRLRYDAGCRSVWGRTPIAPGSVPWAQRSNAVGCLSATTNGGTIYSSGGDWWSWQLNDKNCYARAHVIYGGQTYSTPYY